MQVVGYIAAIAMGATLGLIGGGGSILTVPILVYLLHIDPVRATGYSLFIVGTTALAGGVRYLRSGLVDFHAVVIFGVPSLVGVYTARRVLIPAIPDVVFTVGELAVTKGLLVMVTFAAVMILTAGSMIASRRVEDERPRGPARHRALAALEGLVVGAITGFVGAGGGFLIVPALVFLTGLQVRSAIGTSLAIITVKSLVGFVGELQESSGTDWPLLLAFSALAVGGILGGVELNRRVPASKLKPIFGWFVLVMGVAILLKELT